MVALVDCNNFYASCERVFNPVLEGKPIVVLSNNDGCIIARSQEAKTLGFKMGEPAFQAKEKLQQHNVAVYSSNYTLYGNMSSRVMRTLSGFTPTIEYYSIDEAFLDLSGITHELEPYAQQIRYTVRRNIGIPVSVGIAPTKVLAKVANHLAKKHPDYKEQGVCVIREEMREQILAEFPIGEIWGIGRRHASRLKECGVYTGLDFTKLPEYWVKKHMSVVGQRLQRELKGESCLELELISEPKKNICTSRSFGQMITDLSSLSEAVSTFAARCATKLRKEHTCASQLSVFIHTNQFNPNDKQYSNYITIPLPIAANDSPTLIHTALQGLKMMYREGYRYKKAGVIVSGIVPETQVQQNLFEQPKEENKKLMQVLDGLNVRFGREKVRMAAQGFGRNWRLKSEKLTPCYTTSWDELFLIKG